MTNIETLKKVKLFLRISHSKIDSDVVEWIDACVEDLKMCGVDSSNEADPLILNAIKLYCKSQLIDDVAKSAAIREAYDKLKGSLMMAEGYRLNYAE